MRTSRQMQSRLPFRVYDVLRACMVLTAYTSFHHFSCLLKPALVCSIACLKHFSVFFHNVRITELRHQKIFIRKFNNFYIVEIRIYSATFIILCTFDHFHRRCRRKQKWVFLLKLAVRKSLFGMFSKEAVICW